MITSLTGKDSIIINGKTFNSDLADGDAIALDLPEEMFKFMTGKNGNTVYAKNEKGINANITMRLMRLSDSDKYLQSLFDSQVNDLASFTLMTGQFKKRLGDGNSNVFGDCYLLEGGSFIKQPIVSSNAEGTTDQSIAIWELFFAKATRIIG